MEKLKCRNMVILKENQFDGISGGNDNICAALAGATLASGLLGSPTFMFFGAGYLIFCLEGHA